MQNINIQLLQTKICDDIKIAILPLKSAEIDKMRSFVGSKKNQRWLWHAIDHQTGDVLAYFFGERKDFIF